MCDKGFVPKRRFDTPHSHYRTPKGCKTGVGACSKQDSEYFTPRGGQDLSDSEESTKSNTPSDKLVSSADTGSGSYNSEDLTIVAEFDELMRLMRQQRCDEVEDKFLEFVEQTREVDNQWGIALQECRRLQVELDGRTHDYRDLESKLTNARKLFDKERKRRERAEYERDDLAIKITRAANLLFNTNTHHRLPEETRQQLSFLNNAATSPGVETNGLSHMPQLSTIPEATNTTDSLISELSYTRSDDGLDTSSREHGIKCKKHRPSTEHADEPFPKKRRSTGTKVVEINLCDTIRATTTLTVAKEGPITATSIIETLPVESSVPPHSPNRQVFAELQPRASSQHFAQDLYQRDSPRSKIRQHSFQTKVIVMPEMCGACEKRIGFGRTAYKCKKCHGICHQECKSGLPVPCTPLGNTPTKAQVMGVISDYTPVTSPMVPALIIHCTNEIETRGLNEAGIYRISGAYRDIKALKEKFLTEKGALPALNAIDIHAVCGTVKNFLRSLNEPLVTHTRWRDFVQASEAPNKSDIAPALYQIISELPQPNRDTLAYMILHLKRVADAPNCKMPVENLARVFGPTIVGYSSADPGPHVLLAETSMQSEVMKHLINLPTDYWRSFIDCDDPRTPSYRSRTKKRFFPTPPSYK